jgi:hypothetical protein
LECWRGAIGEVGPAQNVLDGGKRSCTAGEADVRRVSTYYAWNIDGPDLRERDARRGIGNLHREICAVVTQVHVELVTVAEINASIAKVNEWTGRRSALDIEACRRHYFAEIAVQVEFNRNAVGNP